MRTLLLPTLLMLTVSLYGQFPCNGEFILSGTAVQQDDCIQLTANSTFQKGCAWLNTPVDFSEPFTHDMFANFGTTDGSGADGICLIYQTGGTDICGNAGGALGSGGIENSFIVEFDTWDNGDVQSDIDPDHSAIAINGDLNNQIDGPIALPNIEDGQNHTITFQWDPDGNQYTVIFDGNTIMSGTFDIINNCFQGNTIAYWGYTASTGSALNAQFVCPILPPPIPTDAGEDQAIVCSSTQLTLDGTATATGGYTYTWSSPDGGNIISGGNTLTPIVEGPGTYVLTLNDPIEGCEEIDEVSVMLNPLEVNIDAPLFAPCSGGQVSLDASASTSGTYITYQWTTSDGLILSAADQPIIQAGEPGTYTLTITYDDGQITCTEESSVTLQPNVNIPVANATGGNITCNNPTIALNGLGSFSGPEFSYQWETEDGAIISGDQTLTPTVGQAGSYSLTVLNTTTNCFSSVIVEVGEDTTPPNAEATALGDLDCDINEVSLSGAGSESGSDIKYSWQTSEGNIIAGADEITATVNAPGEYFLLVTNEANGCFSIADVTVAVGLAGPEVQLAVNDTLNCEVESVVLDAGASATSPNYTYTWSTSNGEILGNENMLLTTAGAPGTYFFSITDTVLNCMTIDSVVVEQQLSSPVVNAGADRTLDCGTTSITLEGNTTVLEPHFIPTWSTQDGSIVSGAESLTPTAGSSGTYVLTVLDTITQCIGTDTISVVKNIDVPTVSILAPDTLNCNRESIALIGSGSTAGGNGYSMLWSSEDGNTIINPSQLTATVSAPGSYLLEIKDTLNECSAIASVTVVQDTIRPILSIASPDTLSCSRTSLILNSSVNSTEQIELQWNTNNGHITSGSETLSPVVDQPGLYTLEATDTRNFCTSTQSILVEQDTITPTVAILPSNPITCATPSQTLSAQGSSNGAEFSYAWSSQEGNILSGEQSLTPTVDASGTYTIQITNNTNGCINTGSIFVAVDTIAPIADAGQDDTLNCFQPNLQVGGSSTSTGSRFTYSWSSNNPMPESAVDPYLTTNSAGSYTLTVFDTINGCKGVDSILVFEDFNEPVVSIANPDILNCQDSTVTLNANGSSTNGNFRYTWIAQSSSVALPSDTQIATITSPGIYTLLIENLNNGCAAEDSVEVLQDINTPIVSIATADTITCNQPEVTLNAALSGTNSNIDFSWSTAQGNIVSGQTSLQPLVNTSGVYELMVTDLDNFCSTSRTVLVAIDTLKPAITLETPNVLNCLDTALTINGNAVTPQVNWAWTTTNGNIAAEAATASPTIDQPGSYTATVTNPKNGCITTASLQISQDINQPEINVAPPSTLTCDQLTVALDGSGSDFAAGWTAGWKAPDGTTLSNHLQTTISQPGIYTLEILNTDNFCSNSTTITVTQDVVAPEVSLTGADTLNCEVLSVNLTSQVNQTGNLSFEWSSVDGQISSGMNSPNASTSMPGTYYFTAVNQDNGCSALDSLIVQQDTIAPELAPVVPTKLTCGLTSAWLTSTAEVNTNWTYEWSTADGGSINSDANSNAVEAITAGTYNVLVTDTRNACTSTSTHLVSIDTAAPTILLELPGTLNCVDQNVPLTGMGSDSGVNFNLTWSTQDGTIEGPVNQLEAIAASPGTYMLTIQNTVNECIASRSITVSQDTIAPVASISTPEVLNCNNNSILIDATSSSAGAQFAYDWTTNDGLLLNGADGLQPEVGAAGQYALEITNLQNFCSSTATVSIMVDSLSPVVSLVTPDLLDCDQTSVPLAGSVNNAGSDYQLFWEGPANGFIADTNGLNPIIGQPGLYTLTVINNTNGCSASASTTALQDIVAPIVEAGDDFVIPCFPDMRQLDGFGSSEGEAFNYTWSTVNGVVIEGINTLSPAIDAPGIYTLVVLNTENGCAATDSVIVTQDLPEANVSTIQPLCFGDSGQINFVEVSGGFSPYVYSIDGGETYGSDANFSVQTPGNYQLIVQDINGCEVSLSTEIIQPDSLIIETAEKVLEIGIGDNEMIQLRSNYPLQDLVDISWSPNPGLDCYDCLSPTASPDFTTVYQVSATNSNGCKDEADIRVIVNRELPVFIPTGFSPNGDGNNDWFTVYSKQEAIANVRSMEVYSRWGEKVFENRNFQPNNPQEGWDGFFRNQTLSSGVFAYVVEVELIDGSTEILQGDVTLSK